MLSQARELHDQLISWRRAIHRHPELGFQEYETAALAARVMKDLGLQVETGVGITGVVGHLGHGEPVVALRADMDALPIQEENDVPYASEVPGVMHACGHDAHVAMLLGAAALLAQNPPPRGQVRFLFQPSEESSDAEDKSGAVRMIEDGAMHGVEAVFALHVYGEQALGTVGNGAGPIAAASDSWEAKIIGVGGHGAYPHKTIDPIFLAAQIVVALQGIVARRLSPTDSGVLTVGSIHGGTKNNIIPEWVELQGTIRSFRPEVRETILTELERTLQIARTLGGDYQLKVHESYPPTINDPALAELAHQVITELLGAESIRILEPEMGSEDFALLAQAASRGGCFLWLGAALSPARRAHSPTFDIHEDCLPIGAALLASLATRYLSS